MPRSGRLWRPVREVRLVAQRHRAYQPALRRDRQHARAARDLPLVSAPRPLGGASAALDSRRPQGMEDQRLRPVQVVARPRPPAACRHPRPRLGHPRTRRGRRRQGALRVVRRSHRLHLQHQGTAARLVGKVVEGPRDAHHQLHRQGQHRLPLHHIPGHAHGLRRRIPAARQRARQRIPEPRGRQDQHLAQLGRVVARIPPRLPGQAGRAALRAHGQRSRDQGQRLHMGRLPGAQQQRAGGRARQLREPRPRAHAQILRRHRAAAR